MNKIHRALIIKKMTDKDHNEKKTYNEGTDR